jgi:hypothetical protein
MALAATATGALLVLGVRAALACPVCDTATGEAVRNGIAADFGSSLFATIAPFPVLLAVVGVLHRGWPLWRARP